MIYYVKNGGLDSNDGLSDATAFATGGKLNSVLMPGDIAKFKRGDTFDLFDITFQGTELNPIQIDVYGDEADPKPVFTGLQELSGWTSIGSGLYKITDVNLPARINFLLNERALSTHARWPRSSYNQITGGTGSTTGTVSDTVNLSGLDFTGGEVVTKKEAWVTDRQLITSHSGTTLNFSGGSTYNIRSDWGYFIQNHRDACTELGDWCQEGNDIVMFFGAETPTDHTINAPYVETINFTNADNVWINNIRIEGINGGSDATGYIPAFLLSASQNVKFITCEIEFIGNTVFYFEANNNNGFTLLGTSVKNCLNNVFWNRYSSSNKVFNIENSLFENIGHINGAGGNGGLSYTAIAFSGDTEGATVKGNRLINIGYNGINLGGYEFLIEGNFLDNCCMNKDDGGCIYHYGKNDILKTYDKTRRIVRNNIAVNSIGTNEGKPSWFAGTPLPYAAVEAFYFDDDSKEITVENNTGIGCRYGVKLHNTQEIALTNNLLFDNKESQVIFANSNLGTYKNRSITFTGNVLYANAGQLVAIITSMDSDGGMPTDAGLIGMLDNNYYMRPSNEADIIEVEKTGTGANTSLFSLTEWKLSGYGHDANSLGSPTTSQEVELIYNDSSETITHVPNRIRVDKDGNIIASTFDIEPYTAKILLDDQGQAYPLTKHLYTDSIIWDSDLELTGLVPNAVTSDSQMPQIEPLSYYYQDDTVTFRNFGTSGRFKPDVRHPQNPTSSSARLRLEQQLRNTQIKSAVHVRFSLSVYVPESTNLIPYGENTILQWHAGASSPYSSPSWRYNIQYHNSRWIQEIVMRWGNSPTSENYMRVCLGEFVKGQWPDIIVDHVFSNDIDVGRSTVWLNGNIARIYNRDTMEPMVVPTTGNNQDETSPSKGTFETWNGQSVFIWNGKTIYPDPYIFENKYPKFGLMNSELFNGTWYENGELVNTTDPEAPYYMDLSLYGYGNLDFNIDNINFDISTDDDWQWYERISADRNQPNEVPSYFIEKPTDVITHTISVSAGTGGSATGGGTVIEGDEETLTATPDEGFTFDGWFEGGVLASLDNPYVFTVTQDRTLVAQFTEVIPDPITYTVTLTAGTGGSVTGSGEYEDGSTAEGVAIPDPGYTFLKWSDNSTDNPYSFTVSGDISLTALFQQDEPDPVPESITVRGRFKIV